MTWTIYDRSYHSLAAIHERVAELDKKHPGRRFPKSVVDEWNALNETIEEHELEVRHERVRELARAPRNREAGATFHTPPDRRDTSAPGPLDEALRTIQQNVDGGVLRSDAADRLDRLVRCDDRLGLEARYLQAVGDEDYNSAFGKLLADPAQGHLRFTQEETAAVQAVAQAQAMRGMVIGTDTAGGFAVPFQLDPTILLTSSGALNPIRSVSRVITISTDKWKGVSSAGVTASYDAEASEVSDDTPTLAQPTIDAAMARAFVPFSIELGQDWGSLQQELAQLTADARDVLDATQFLTGSGTDSPAGVLTGLSTSQRVQTTGAGAIAIGDIYALRAAVPARWINTATWAAHPNRLDTVYRLTPSGSTTEPQAMPTRDGALVGKPVVEWTTMATTSTTGSKWAIYGDFHAAFTIADRIGMTAELVPHLFGAARRPTGERGYFAYWRTGSKVVVPEALRYGEVL